jgi:Phage tail protein (Tail_P2_I)
MSGSPSSIGFGWQLYGFYPFGSSDWAEEVTWKILPVYKHEQDIVVTGVPYPLRKFIDGLKPLLEELRFKWQQFPFLWDANRCPLSNLPQLAYTVGLVDDPSKPEALRRSQILNVAQLVLNKGNDRGYEIIAALNGLLVSITPLWADDCYTTAPADFGTTGPTEFYATFGSFGADEVVLDEVFDDFYARWPKRLTWTDPCRTAWLDLHFYAPGDVEIDDLASVALSIQQDLPRVLPIHVRIRNTTYDGPRAVGGGWTIPVQGAAMAVGGGWTIPVDGALMSAGGWTIPVVATPVP